MLLKKRIWVLVSIWIYVFGNSWCNGLINNYKTNPFTYLHSGLSFLELEISILPLKSSSIHMNDWGWSFHYCWHQKWDRHVGYVFLGSSVFAGECSEISMYGNKSWKYLNRKYWIPKYCHRSFARIKQRRKLKKLQMNILPDYAGNLLSCKLYTAVI